MARRTNQACLIVDAMHHGEAVASSWHAWHDDDGLVYVSHYRTTMVAYDPTTNDATGLSRGWGSMTDKCGVGKILRGVGARQSTYREVFDGVTV